MDEDEIQAPGWDAIDRWVGGQLGGQTPHQFTSRTPYELDSRSPLPAITVWATRGAGAGAGWLYVSYGLSELFEKSSGDPAISGFGFELSLRVPGEARTGPEAGTKIDDRPPRWPLRLLQSLGHHVLDSARGFDSGHVIDLGGSLVPPGEAGPERSALVGLVCLPDPLLGKVSTVNGSLLFLRLFGVTRDELEIFDQLELGDLVACAAELSPLAITDPRRRSHLEDPERAKILRRYKLGISL